MNNKSQMMHSNPVFVAEAVPVNDYGNFPSSAPPVVAQSVVVNNNTSAYSNLWTNTINEPAAREFLEANKWPRGLQDSFIQQLRKIPIRFFICDDSGSMSTNDGHRLVAQHGKGRFVSCTRWNELTTALSFHSNLARAANAATEFRFLNNSYHPIMIGDGQDYDNSKFQIMTNILQTASPNGGTPLCHHINEIVEKIRSISPQLRANGQKACVVIATDGESSDGDIATALRPLQQLPVWVVIRLCTDEDRIVDYWNNIDSQLELDMDVLDDLEGEAEEIKQNNSWLIYTEALHRMREFGVTIKEMDLLDESSLSLDQIRFFCAML